MPYTKFLILPYLLILTACTPKPTDDIILFLNTPFVVNGDTIQISRDTWNTQKLGSYPFTSDGILACTLDEVMFFPTNSKTNPIIDFEHAKATPINQKAKNSLDTSKTDYLPLKDHIHPSSDLTTAIELGLTICDYNTI